MAIPTVAIVFAAASMMGRSSRPAPAVGLIAPRSYSPPSTVYASGVGSPSYGGEPRVLDLATGSIGRWPFPKEPRFDLATPSPWVDETGHRQVVGRQLVRSGDSLEVVLARYLLPEVRLVDRTPLDAPLFTPPCWDPSGSGLLLYVGLDGNVYRVDLSGKSPRPSVLKVAWQVEGTVPRGSRPMEIGWFRSGGSRDYLIATMTIDEARPRRRNFWWLRLDPDSRAVDDAGPLFDPSDQGWRGESDLVVSMTGDRRALLAFLEKTGGPSYDLFVAELRADPTTGNPSVGPDGARLVSGDCERWAPAFTTDGRHLYCLKRSGETTRFVRCDASP